MKLTIKTLQQNTFKVEIEAEKTVKELKETIEKEQGKDYPSGAQKLIYSGKILADESKLSEYEIDEKKFVVLMITRPPPAPKAPEKQTAAKTVDESTGAKPKANEEKSRPSATQSFSSSLSSTTTSTVPTTNATTVAPTSTPTTTSTGNNNARGSLPPVSTEATRPSNTGRPSDARPSAMSSNEPLVASRLATLMSQPQFRQIQDLIQQSPQLLTSTIEALASSDPEMYSFMTENPEMFINALNHPPLSGSRQTPSSRSSTTGGQQQSGRQSDRLAQQQAHAAGQIPGSRQQPVVDQILGDASEHDKEAIERLKELGFSEYLAIQAYMACDKDEQLAANLLFQMDQ